MSKEIHERDFTGFRSVLVPIEPTGKCKKRTVIENGIETVHEYIQVYRKLFGFKIGTRWVNRNNIVVTSVKEEYYDIEV